MLNLSDGRIDLYQWDTGRKLTVDEECSQVHFSNKLLGRSIDCDVVNGVANVPDVLLQTDKDLIAWAFVGTPENGYTKMTKVFKVNQRNKPADYVFTPTEQTTLGKIMQRLDELEEMQSPDAIKNAVDNYLADNPIQVDEKDPTVPDWAKQPLKPEYTANEVGAISQSDLQDATNEALNQAKESGEFDGDPGADGYTPVRGTDYWTPADIAEIKSYVDESIGEISADSLIRYPNNLYKGEIKEGGYYSNGVWKENAAFKAAILPIGSVKNGDTITFPRDYYYSGTSYLFDAFKADGTWLQTYNISSYGTITISQNANDVADGFYLAMRIRSTQDHTKLVIVNDGILEPIPYFEYLQKTATPIKRKVFNCIGDSFTAPVTSWCKQLADRTGCVCNNYGVANSRVSIDTDSGVLSFLNRYSSMDTNSDATIIFGGINDAGSIGQGVLTLGDIDSELNNETFYGALKLLITNIKQLMPGKKIIGVIPPDFSHNYDTTLPKIQVACREIYESFAIPYVDLKKDCQEMFRDDYNTATYRRGTSDYHPSVLGQVAISEVIQGTLEKYIKV